MISDGDGVKSYQKHQVLVEMFCRNSWMIIVCKSFWVNEITLGLSVDVRMGIQQNDNYCEENHGIPVAPCGGTEVRHSNR